MCFGVGVGAGAEPVPLGEVRRGRPGLLAVRARQPSPSLGRLQLHRRCVGAGVRLGVSDCELHLVAEDLRQELLLQPVVPVADQGLADDADTLADLRAAAAGQSLVEEVLVEALAVLAAVLLRPGDPEPAPLAELGHELAALRGVDDLGHVLSGEVEDLRIVVLVEERLDLLTNATCSGEKSKSMEMFALRIVERRLGDGRPLGGPPRERPPRRRRPHRAAGSD